MDRCVQDTTHTPAFRGLTTGLATGYKIPSAGSRWYGARQPSEGPGKQEVPGEDAQPSPPQAALIKPRNNEAQVTWGPRLCLPFTSKGPQCSLGTSTCSESSHGHLRNTPKLDTKFHNISAPLRILFVCIFITNGEGNGNPLPVVLPGKSHGRRSLVGCSPWGR